MQVDLDLPFAGGNLPQTAVVVTTIGKGEFLECYHEAAAEEGVLDRVTFFVIPDRKSPPALYARCLEARARGLRVVCPTLQGQQAFLDRVDFGRGMIPFDSDNRRNIGYLMALTTDAEVVISIDDDNFPRPGERYFAEHAVVALPQFVGFEAKTTDGWFNLCSMLDLQPAGVYPRGYPYHRRHAAQETLFTETTGRVTINAGLWLGEPDLDGMTWLVAPARAHALDRGEALLGRHTWSPVNTQNTALHRDCIAAYYFARMGYPLAGLMSIDRYGDILSGYLVQACAKHLGHYIRAGTPAVDHRRNAHHYLRDATCEMGCVWLIEDLTAWLTGLKLSGSTYDEAFACLAEELDHAAERFTGFVWTEATRGYLHQLAYCMRRWINACAAAAALRETSAAVAA